MSWVEILAGGLIGGLVSSCTMYFFLYNNRRNQP